MARGRERKKEKKEKQKKEKTTIRKKKKKGEKIQKIKGRKCLSIGEVKFLFKIDMAISSAYLRKQCHSRYKVYLIPLFEDTRYFMLLYGIFPQNYKGRWLPIKFA